MTVPGHVVVAGAGLAGLRTIEELRGRGYGGRVTLVGAEPRLPYDRPPLSKKVMTGALDDTTLRDELDSLDVRVLLARRAMGLVGQAGMGPRGGGPGGGVLRTESCAGPGGVAGGEAGPAREPLAIAFDALVIATGANPVTLPGEGRQHLLRTADDALELRKLLVPGARLAIVGAGWIGAELATAAAHLGCQVTVLEAGPAPLSAAIGAEVGALTARWYAAAGVDLRLRQGVDSVQPGGLALVGDGWLAADVVVTAVGVRPATGWLAGSGIAMDNGVAVDGQLRSSVPGVFAVGDCAAFQSARYGRRLRFEHWDVALHAPEVAAANILGDSAVYDPVPYFWSEQFGRMVQYVGYHGAADRLIWRGEPGQDRWAVAWLAGTHMVALLTVGLPRDSVQGRRLISSGAPVDPGRLADPQIPVRDCVLT